MINKSKGFSKPIGEPFDEFKKSLPKELVIGENYRLEAAWKAYGSPKDYKHALWEGMILPIDENTYKLPSIGYNEETEEYEYLNKGKENETVNKDIRVWDNDVIPFVKELKQGGFIRVYNEEKDCWTYSKLEQVNIQKELSEELKQEEVEAFKQGGQMTTIPSGSLHARKNGMELAEKGEITSKGIPVVDNDGNLLAEIERNEVIFSKDVTDKIEELYKKFNSEEISEDEKDKIAIKMGKIITCELTTNTDDRTGLIEEVELKM